MSRSRYFKMNALLNIILTGILLCGSITSTLAAAIPPTQSVAITQPTQAAMPNPAQTGFKPPSDAEYRANYDRYYAALGTQGGYYTVSNAASIPPQGIPQPLATGSYFQKNALFNAALAAYNNQLAAYQTSLAANNAVFAQYEKVVQAYWQKCLPIAQAAYNRAVANVDAMNNLLASEGQPPVCPSLTGCGLFSPTVAGGLYAAIYGWYDAWIAPVIYPPFPKSPVWPKVTPYDSFQSIYARYLAYYQTPIDASKIKDPKTKQPVMKLTAGCPKGEVMGPNSRGGVQCVKKSTLSRAMLIKYNPKYQSTAMKPVTIDQPDFKSTGPDITPKPTPVLPLPPPVPPAPPASPAPVSHPPLLPPVNMGA